MSARQKYIFFLGRFIQALLQAIKTLAVRCSISYDTSSRTAHSERKARAGMPCPQSES